jgi:hypothetical protein
MYCGAGTKKTPSRLRAEDGDVFELSIPVFCENVLDRWLIWEVTKKDQETGVTFTALAPFGPISTS